MEDDSSFEALLRAVARAPAETPEAPDRELVGRQIGPYKTLALVARGGMDLGEDQAKTLLVTRLGQAKPTDETRVDILSHKALLGDDEAKTQLRNEHTENGTMTQNPSNPAPSRTCGCSS